MVCAVFTKLGCYTAKAAHFAPDCSWLSIHPEKTTNCLVWFLVMRSGSYCVARFCSDLFFGLLPLLTRWTRKVVSPRCQKARDGWTDTTYHGLTAPAECTECALIPDEVQYHLDTQNNENECTECAPIPDEIQYHLDTQNKENPK